MEFEHKENSIEKLRILLAIPVLLEHITNAFRIAHGLNCCPDVHGITIKLIEGSKYNEEPWKLESI